MTFSSGDRVTVVGFHEDISEERINAHRHNLIGTNGQVVLTGSDDLGLVGVNLDSPVDNQTFWVFETSEIEKV